jgi:hypothetical protein
MRHEHFLQNSRPSGSGTNPAAPNEIEILRYTIFERHCIQGMKPFICRGAVEQA